MEHPPKQGLKPVLQPEFIRRKSCFNGTSTKTRIETKMSNRETTFSTYVLMEHPPKQGLKLAFHINVPDLVASFNGTSTKTRIETDTQIGLLEKRKKF